MHEKSETLLNLYHEKYLKDGKQRCKRAEIKLQSMPRDSFFLEPCRTFFGYYELTSCYDKPAFGNAWPRSFDSFSFLLKVIRDAC